MSIFERVKSFVEDETITGENFEAEFDAIAEAFNGLFRAARVGASAELTLTGSSQDVPGATLSITPAVPSLLLVFATAEIETVVGGTGEQLATLSLNVDGVDRAEPILSGFPLVATTSQHETVGQDYCISLTAAAHTVKLRGKASGPFTSRVKEAGTGFVYLLIPQP
jgi:hypothetical protein